MRVGGPSDAGLGSNLERELVDGNHNATDKHANKVWAHAAGGVNTGRAIVAPSRLVWVMQGLWLNPVGALDITPFDVQRRAGGEWGGRQSMDETTCWDHIPECCLANAVLWTLWTI